jgi:predicted phosphodiesterase
MKIIKSDAELELITLYPLGDWHLGSEHCDVKLINKQINEIKKDQTARIILMGDLAETATKESVGAGVYEQEQNAQQQMMRVKNLLYDVRHLIDGVVTGNHEERIYKTSGFDLSLYLCQMLEIENKYMRYQGVVGYVIGQRSYLVNVWHGSGGGGSAGASLNRLQKQSEYVLADIYLMGHVHKRQVHTKQMIIPNPRYEKKEIIMQYFVATGSSLDYENSYAESAGMTPSQKGFTKIKMWTERNNTDEGKERQKRIEVMI